MEEKVAEFTENIDEVKIAEITLARHENVCVKKNDDIVLKYFVMFKIFYQ